MNSRAGKSQSKDQARPLKRLSLAKKDEQRGRAKQNGSNKQKGLSITSFFKNTPPSKLACPLCNKFIPRFKINEHIDSQCQEFLEENDPEALPGSHNKQEKTLSDNVPRTPDKTGDSSVHGKDQDAKMSPYFKNNCAVKHESPKAYQDKVVRTVSLGSLSSKLSGRALKFSESPKTAADKESDCSEPTSSQKENCDENISVKSPQASPSEVATVNIPVVENEHRLEEVSSLSTKTSHSVKTAAPFRLMKRKKVESPETCAAPDLQKKRRYSENRSENGPFPVVDQSPTSCVNASSQEFAVSKAKLGVVERDQILAPSGSGNLPQKPSEGSVEHGPHRQTYYLQNFLTIVEAVMENEDDEMLFNEEDLSFVNSFKQLSGRVAFLFAQF